MNQNVIAIDISDDSIKTLELNNACAVVAYGSDSIKKGVVEDGYIRDMAVFKEKLHAILARTKPNIANLDQKTLWSIVSLPESKVFIHDLVLPDTLEKEDVSNYVKKEASKVMPYDLANVYATHHLTRLRDEQHAIFVCAPKDIVDNYTKALTQAGLRPAAIGGSFFSLGRAVLPDQFDDKNYIIVDIGEHTSNIGVFDVSAIANFTARILIGGAYFTEALVRKLDIKKREAEKLKREVGVDHSFKKDKAAETLEKCLDKIIEKIQKVKDYYEEKTGQKITHLVLAGGSALMPGITGYFEDKTGLKTACADPFLKIKDHEMITSDSPSIFYANVVGLALRVVNKDLPGIDLLEQYRRDTSDENKQRISIGDIRNMNDFVNVARDHYMRTVHVFKRLIVRFKIAEKISVKFVFSFLFALFSVIGLFVVIRNYM